MAIQLPTYNYIEANNLKGLQPGFVVAQNSDVDTSLLTTDGMFENGKICTLNSANKIVAGTAESKALFIHYTEPLNTIFQGDRYFAVNPDEECPRLVQLIPGDEWMSTAQLEEDTDQSGNKIGILGGRIIELSAGTGFFANKMANGDTGYHYVFLG